MTTCMLCHFDVVADDVAITGPRGRTICIRCFARETGNTLRMSRKLRQAVSAVLDSTGDVQAPVAQAYM